MKKKKEVVTMYKKLRTRLDGVIKMDRHSPYFMTEASKLAEKIVWAKKWHKISDIEGMELIADMTRVFEGEV